MSRKRSYKKNPLDLDFTFTSNEFEEVIKKKDYTEHRLSPKNGVVMNLSIVSQKAVKTSNFLVKKKITTLQEYYKNEKYYLGAMALEDNDHLIFELANLYTFEVRKFNTDYHKHLLFAFEYYKMYVGVQIFKDHKNKNTIDALDHIISYYENTMNSPDRFNFIKFDISVVIAYKYILYSYTTDSYNKKVLLKNIKAYTVNNFTKKNKSDVSKYIDAVEIIISSGKTQLTTDGKKLLLSVV